MRRPLLGLCLLWLAAPGAALAQASAPPAPAPAPASAGPTADPGKPSPQLMDAAKRHYDDAVRFYQEGSYEAARVEFEASFALSKAPDLLYNLSTTAEKQGQTADAIRYAERYLEAKPSAEDAEKVRERIARLRQGGAMPPAPSVQLPTASQPPVSPPATPAAPAPSTLTPDAPAAKPPLPRAPIALLGVGGALLLGGIGAGAGALVTQSDLESRVVSYREYTSLQDRGNALNIAAISLSVAGGVAVVAGGIWLAVAHARRSQAR